MMWHWYPMFTNAAFLSNVHEMHTSMFIKDFSTCLALEMTVAKAIAKNNDGIDKI